MSDPSLNLLVEYLVDGGRKRSLNEVKKLLDAHVDREKIITDGEMNGRDLSYIIYFFIVVY